MEEKYFFIVGGSHLQLIKVVDLLPKTNFKIHFYTNFYSKDLIEISRIKNVEIFEISSYENIEVNYFYIGGIFLNQMLENYNQKSFIDITSSELRNCISENFFLHLGFMKSILKQKKTKYLSNIFLVKFDFKTPDYTIIMENIYSVLISFAHLEFKPMGVQINQINLNTDSNPLLSVLQDVLFDSNVMKDSN